MPVIEGVLDAQIDAPQPPSIVQQRTAATPLSSSVQATSGGASDGQASTVSANGWSGCRGGGGGVGGGGDGGSDGGGGGGGDGDADDGGGDGGDVSPLIN